MAPLTTTHVPIDTKSELRVLLSLALPVMLTQFGQMLLGIVDTIMVGHMGVQSMAAVALANSYCWISLMAATGVVIGMDPLVSQAHGARDARQVALTLQQGVVLALLISVPVMVLWHYTGAVLLAFGQKPELARIAQQFVDAIVWSVPCFILFMALRQYLQGRGLVAPAMWAIALTNVLNVPINWALIYGHLGMPALGITGAGLASGIANAVSLCGLTLLIFALRLYDGGWQPWSRDSYDPRGILRIVRLGLPIGLQFGLEVTAFSAAAMMAGWLGDREVSAHTISLNMAALTFMLPLGISIGTATRVGNLIGEAKPEAARRVATLALKLSVSVMTCCAAALVLLRHLVPRAYTADARVLAFAAAILPIVAGFQIADGTQVVCTGILRGLGRTRAPAVGHLLGYYVLGLPAAYLLAFRAGLGVLGIWWGLLIGLTSLALLLFGWLQLALRKPLIRLGDSALASSASGATS